MQSVELNGIMSFARKCNIIQCVSVCMCVYGHLLFELLISYNICLAFLLHLWHRFVDSCKYSFCEYKKKKQNKQNTNTKSCTAEWLNRHTKKKRKNLNKLNKSKKKCEQNEKPNIQTRKFTFCRNNEPKQISYKIHKVVRHITHTHQHKCLNTHWKKKPTQI